MSCGPGEFTKAASTAYRTMPQENFKSDERLVLNVRREGKKIFLNIQKQVSMGY